MQSKSAVTIPANTIATVPIHFSNLQASDRDFLFEPCELDQLSLFVHVLNHNVSEILIKNPTNHTVNLPQNTRLGHLSELGIEQALIATAFVGQTHEELAQMAERPPKHYKSPSWFMKGITTLSATYSILTGVNLAETHIPETHLSNGIMIYGTSDSPQVQQLTHVVESFPDLWIDSGRFVDIPQHEWMKIPLRTDWES